MLGGKKTVASGRAMKELLGNGVIYISIGVWVTQVQTFVLTQQRYH